MGRANVTPIFDEEYYGLSKMNFIKNIFTKNILRGSYNQLAGIDQFALAYLDINNFKYIFETYGQMTCDEIIMKVTDYLESKVKKPNYVTRIACDKFIIIFTDYTTQSNLYWVMDDIISNCCIINTPEFIFYITMNAGVSLYPEHGKDIDTLIEKAETACYLGKSNGKEINIYSDVLKNNIIEQVRMTNMLQSGIEKEELTLFFQPEFNLDTNAIIGVEALVRWPQPANGFISPDIFIPLAEKTKQIYVLERWIINKALQQKEQWEKEGLGDIELSINLSGKTLESEINFNKIEEIIASFNVNFNTVIFEITETVVISQVDLVIERLNRLRSYGIKIALDDFGTGYSSLAHIMRLPIDIVKIDRSFIKALPYGRDEAVITKNIIAMAHDLNYRVVAEGIETQAQLEYLRRLSCERGQGFLLCKPLPSEKLYEVIEGPVQVLC